jgi:hypothetical protein
MEHQKRECILLFCIIISTLSSVGLLIQNSSASVQGSLQRQDYQSLVQGPGFESADAEEESPLILDPQLKPVWSHVKLSESPGRIPLSNSGG